MKVQDGVELCERCDRLLPGDLEDGSDWGNDFVDADGRLAFIICDDCITAEERQKLDEDYAAFEERMRRQREDTRGMTLRIECRSCGHSSDSRDWPDDTFRCPMCGCNDEDKIAYRMSRREVAG